jgi:NADH-quinone oxidoreductase subunit I
LGSLPVRWPESDDDGLNFDARHDRLLLSGGLLNVGLFFGGDQININPDTNETLCISCNLCALACPENLIVVSSVRNEQTHRKDLTTFTYDLSRCMFCGLCEDACPVDALELTQDFELASYTRDGGIWDRQMLEEGPRPMQYK